MKASTDRILTTHVGTLPHRTAFTEALDHKLERAEQYEVTLRESVGEVVRQQVAAGVDVVNDGELGKAAPNQASSWASYVSERLGGFELRPTQPGTAVFRRSTDRERFAGFYAEALRLNALWYASPERPAPPPSSQPMQWVCTGQITYTGQAAVQRDIANFREALEGQSVAEAFMPVVAPASIEPGRPNAYYGSEEEYVYAIASAMAVEYRAIVDAGFVVQIDDAWIPALWDLLSQDMSLDDYKRRCRLRIEALNHALHGIPADRVRYHLCWGSWHGPHVSDVPLRDIVDLMLAVNAGAYSFEAANVRHEHEYHLWEDVRLPEGKLIIPGVVSHATNVVEHPELVAERIMRFVRLVGRERVLAGTDCGLGGRVHPDIAWAKLETLAEGARLASQRLWA
ncbi:MAG: cobalamin-independent methionine synthase II family protein [Chloroflexi bacterium]|nr:cobalamin-independent methionine synthase II family protein [Chloroflexota bacterium]